MTRRLLHRLASALFVVWGVTTLVFVLIHLIPGDPVDVMLGETARAADRTALRESLGLHLPLHQQLAEYYQRLVHFDFGTSVHSGRDVAAILLERFPATLELGLAAMLVAVALALPLGILSAMKHHTPMDTVAMTAALAGVSIPNFWLGPMLILVGAVWVGWFPVSGRTGWMSLVLPALTLGTAMAALLSRMIRSTLLDVLHKDYIRTARAKGLSDYQIVRRHALRNTFLPLITILGLQLGTVLGGAVITETIFAWPGVGSLTIDAIHARDYPVVQASVICISVLYVVVNTVTDVLYAWVNPRIRL